MCGIFGCIIREGEAVKLIIDGLRRLEYRGYDSTGVVIIENNHMDIRKDKGRIDDVVKDPGLGLIDVGPKGPDHRGREHHGQQDQRGPGRMPLELAIDEQRQAEAEQHLKEHRPANKMRGRLQIAPDVLAGQQALVVACADPLHLPARLIGAVVGEGQHNRPDQRKDVDRQQQQDRRQNEDPGHHAIGNAAPRKGRSAPGG